MYRFVLAALATCFLTTSATSISAQESDAYLLRYKLRKGEQVRYRVTHVAKTKTRVKGSEGVSQVHTVSDRHWDVQETTASGESTFDHIIDSVSMTQQQDDQEELRWDSNSDEEAPEAFAKVALSIGETLTTLTINPQGKEIRRKDNGANKSDLGMGSLTLSLPEKALKVGEKWNVSREIKTRTEDGLVKPIKIREVYTLEKVQTGVATLAIKSQPLTPILEESVRAQVVQHLSNGTIKFDIDQGRMISKQLDWDETVVGFQGPNSMMEYRARMTEELVSDVTRTAKKPD